MYAIRSYYAHQRAENAWRDLTGQLTPRESHSVNPHRQLRETVHEGGQAALRLANHLHHAEALEDLLPHHTQLHLGETVAHAAMDPESE